MLVSFLQDKFEYDYHVNRNWCVELSRHEDSLNDFVLRQMSHLINVHHIWISRLHDSKPESADWDRLPLIYWERLNTENFQRTMIYLEHFDESLKVHYHDSEGVPMEKQSADILYHILQHSQYHRAQIARELRLLEIPVPSMHFIQYR